MTTGHCGLCIAALDINEASLLKASPGASDERPATCARLDESVNADAITNNIKSVRVTIALFISYSLPYLVAIGIRYLGLIFGV
jgi:hypothetical protein